MTAKEKSAETVVSVPHVYTAISEVAAAISKTGIAKGRRNQEQRYQFRGIDDMYNELSGLMSVAGLIITPKVLTREQTERQTRSGGALFSVVVHVEFTFISVRDGSTHVVTTFGEAMDTADKATNKAMSAAYKYAVMQAFCIPTEGDNDADAKTHDVKGADPVADQPQQPPQGETIEQALVRLVPEAARERVSAIIRKAYGGVLLLEQIPADKTSEAITKLKDYVAAQAARKGKTPT